MKRAVGSVIEDVKGEGDLKRRVVAIIDSDDEEDYFAKKSYADEVMTNGNSHVTLALNIGEAELNVIGEYNGIVNHNKRLLKERLDENLGK